MATAPWATRPGFGDGFRNQEGAAGRVWGGSFVTRWQTTVVAVGSGVAHRLLNEGYRGRRWRQARSPMVTKSLSPTTLRQVVDVARDLHRRLGGGWSPTVYRDGLALLLCEAGIATCAGRQIGAAPCLARDLVAASSLVIRVAGVKRQGRPLAECLARTGLEAGVLLNFGNDQVEATVVRSTGTAADPVAEHGGGGRTPESPTIAERCGNRAVA